MSSDRTQHQSNEELAKARELSLEPIRPPSNPPGYRIQGFVGRGSYGEVWLATDLKTGRQVAIKFYLHGSGQQIKRLADEVEKLVVLSADRYVVQLLDVGWEAEPPYYVMEYIEHGSLEDLLRFQGSIDTVEAVELFRELALGMMHLHGKGILHCDLKPGNVLLDEGGRPRVADFGQSRLTSDQSAALGTLFYMAPEQADTTAVPDSGWDVYALG
ncbi:MAG: serine/threonine-protein kinase, partial [Planctomycetota bacterium]